MLFNKVYKFLRSSRLTIVLIIYGIVISILGTYIPQNQNFSFYVNNYPKIFSTMILKMNLNSVSKSLFTIIPLILFSLNIIVCTGSRIYLRQRRKAKQRYGPDLIHLSLIFLIIGGFFTVSQRHENNIFLVEGDSGNIFDEYSLALNNLDHQTYDNGKVKYWLTNLDLYKDGVIIENIGIQVNKPFKFQNYVIYLMAYNLKQTVLIGNKESTMSLEKGDLIDLGSELYIYRGNEVNSGVLKARFAKYGERNNVGQDYEIGEELGEFTISNVFNSEESGFKIVKDPGVKYVMIGLIAMIIGLFVTVIQKIKDGRIGWQQ
jgi:cytochrome c biogenesis protein ResB